MSRPATSRTASTNVASQVAAASTALRRAACAAVERLEERRLFSTINWVNEGSAGSDSDGFDAIYGDDADVARDCVRAAISAWERVIVDFNYADGSNTFDIEITALDIDDGGAGGQHVCNEVEDGLPISGVLELDDDAAGTEWFFDPTPMYREEFTTVRNAFAAEGDLDNDPDFYGVVLHELGHAMGITNMGGPQIWDHLSDTGVTDPDEVDGGELLTLNGFPGHVLTDAGGLHIWGGINSVPGYSGHEFDLMTTTLGNDDIRVISSFDAYVLEQAYGYTIQDPVTLPDQQFIAVINPTSRVLTINGNCNPSVLDKITLVRDGDDLLVKSNFDTVRLPLSEFDSINFTAAVVSGDSTTLTLDMSGGDMIPSGGLTFDGDAGDDVLTIDLRNGGELPAAQLNFTGNDGTDALHVLGKTTEANELIVEELFIKQDQTSALATSGIDVESVVVEGGEKNDSISVEFTSGAASSELLVVGNEGDDQFVVWRAFAAIATDVDGGKGDDTLTVTNKYQSLSGINGDVHFSGSDGFDRIFIDNSKEYGDVVYNLTATTVVRPMVPSTITHWSTEERTLEAGNGKNDVNVISIAQFTTTFVNAAEGDDSFLVDSLPGDPNAGDADQVRGQLVIDGGAGDNRLVINDAGDASGDFCTITEDSIGAAYGENFFDYTGSMKYANLNTIDIVGAMGSIGGGNTFAVLSTSPQTSRITVSGGAGDDAFIVGGTYKKYTAGSVDGVRSQVVLKGTKGTDQLKIDDTADVTGDVVTVTPDRVGAHANDTFFGAGGSVQYEGMASLTLFAGGGGNTVYVVGTNAATTTGIHSGLGDDQVFVDSNRDVVGGTVNSLVSALTVNTSAGIDTLLLQDADDTTADIATIYPTTVSTGAADNFFGAGGKLTYIAVDTLTVNAGKAADDVIVLGTKAGTQTVINGNDGVDKVTLGSLTVDAIVSEVVFDGGAGDDLLIANDSSDNSNDVLTLTTSQLGAAVGDSFFGVGGKLTFNSLKAISVGTGSGADTIHVQRTVPNLDVNLTTGLGADAINIGWNNRVNEIRGKITISAQSDSDTLTINDSAETSSRQVSVMTDKVGVGPGDSFFYPGAFVSFTGIDTVNLNAGNGHDTINVWAVNTGTLMTVNAGGGSDTVNLDSNGSLSGGTVNEVKGQLTVNGNAGVNTVNVIDASDAAATTATVTPMSDTSGFVGNMPGDNLFGVGGKLTYNSMQDLYLYTGSGADTIKLTPAITPAGTKYHVRTGAGADVLQLNLAGTTNPVLQINPNGTGSLTSANRAPVDWTGVETVM